MSRTMLPPNRVRKALATKRLKWLLNHGLGPHSDRELIARAMRAHGYEFTHLSDELLARFLAGESHKEFCK